MSNSEDSGDSFEEFKAQCLSWFENASQKRFKRLPNGYKVDRWVTTTAMLLLFLWFFIIANSYNYDLDYYKCINGPGMAEFYPDGSKKEMYSQDFCKNPFYKPTTWKNQEYLPPGEYGTKLGPMFHSVYYTPFIFFGLAFGLNHLLHNKRRKP